MRNRSRIRIQSAMRPSALVIVLLSSVVPGGFSCNVHVKPRNRAKIVEDYVLSANFNDRKDVPQLGDQMRDASPEAKDASHTLHSYKALGDFTGDFEPPLENRDLLVHHHHVPPPPPPHPPPPPVGLALGPSMFAMGLLAFLILLNGLSSQLLMVLKTKAGLLPTGSNVLGRRRRDVHLLPQWLNYNFNDIL